MNLVILIIMILTFLVVLGGFALLMRGGEANRKYSNKLMSLRVVLQGLVIALVVIVAWLTKKHTG